MQVVEECHAPLEGHTGLLKGVCIAVKGMLIDSRSGKGVCSVRGGC